MAKMFYCLVCGRLIADKARTKYCTAACANKAEKVQQAMRNKKKREAAKVKKAERRDNRPKEEGKGRWAYYCTHYHQLISLAGCKRRWEVNTTTGEMIDVYCREVCRGKHLRESTKTERQVHLNRIRQVEREIEATC